jgi:hypothetical protein
LKEVVAPLKEGEETQCRHWVILPKKKKLIKKKPMSMGWILT